MSITINGTLESPTGINNNDNFLVKITSYRTHRQHGSIKNYSSINEIQRDGAYNITVENGTIRIETKTKKALNWTQHGACVIDGSEDISTLNELIVYAENHQLESTASNAAKAEYYYAQTKILHDSVVVLHGEVENWHGEVSTDTDRIEDMLNNIASGGADLSGYARLREPNTFTDDQTINGSLFADISETTGINSDTQNALNAINNNAGDYVLRSELSDYVLRSELDALILARLQTLNVITAYEDPSNSDNLILEEV